MLCQLENQTSEDDFEKSSSEWGGRAHEQDYSRVCQEHEDIHGIAQVVLSGYSQHDGISNQQGAIDAPELWDRKKHGPVRR